MKSITIECPEKLHAQLAQMVELGWVESPELGIIEALRRFVDSHDPKLQEMQILGDVEWGLHGDD